MLDHNQGSTLKPIDRDNIVFFKRRPQVKSHLKSMTDQQDIESATSLKASSNQPLPELQKDKRKLVIKPFVGLESRHATPLIEKEVRQHENILLKQRNNLLSSQNLKLKTKLTVLEKENQRLQRSIENENGPAKPSTSYSNNRDKMKAADTTLRVIIRGLRKEVQDMKKENLNIKSTVKFTSLKELQAQRDQLAEETIRLRITLQEEQARKTAMKNNNQGVSHLQHKIQVFSDKNTILIKQLSQVTEKCKKLEESANRTQRAIQSDKKSGKALQTALLQIREKDKQIQQLKALLKTSHSIPSVTNSQTPKQNKFQIKRSSMERGNLKSSSNNSKSTSLQKNQNASECQKCKKYQNENKMLVQKIKKLESDIEKAKGSYGQLPKGPIAEVKPEEIQELKRFLMLRFKAHRLTYEQSEKYLINCEGDMTQPQTNKSMTVRELIQSLLVEPFCIVSNRYLQVIIWKLAFGETKEGVSIDDNKSVKKLAVLQAYRSFMVKYEILSQQKQEEMFIQVAELVTTYYQQILAGLTAKRNGQGTISQKAFLAFFKQIQLQQEYIDFMITQIILESLDMEHLNFFAMFEIFYMPQMASQTSATAKKKKFEVQHEQVVHQQDEEYEESKSYIASRNKTLEQRDKDEEEEMQYEWSEQKQNKAELGGSNNKTIRQQKQENYEVQNQKGQQYYGQNFEQQAEKGLK